MKPARRAIIIKKDGAVSIHKDATNTPLNYMAAGNTFTEDIGLHDDGSLGPVWKFDSKWSFSKKRDERGEEQLPQDTVIIQLHEIVSDVSFDLEETKDKGLIRDRTERHLQAWLAANPTTLGGNFKLVSREFQTGDGPVDLLVVDEDSGQFVAVEVKRTAAITAVDQVRRYVDALRAKPGYENTRGMVAALDVRPKTFILAEKRDIECHVIQSDWQENYTPEEAEESDS